MPILFSEGLVHRDVAGNRNVESAGFVTLVPLLDKGDGESYINATVHGESFTLGIGNRGDIDNKIIEAVINNHY